MLGIRPWGIIVVYQSAPRASRWHESTPLDSPGDRQENDLPAKGQKGGPMNEQSLVTRVNRLERENRRMKLAGVLVLLGIAAVIVMGQTKAKRVAKQFEAERFILRDASGKLRGGLSVFPDGTVGLVITGEKRNAGVAIQVLPDGTSTLELTHSNNQRVTLSITPNEITQLTLGVADKTPVLGAAIFKSGKSALLFLDNNSKQRALLQTDPDGTPALSLFDKNQQTRVGLGLSKGGEPSISLSDKNAQGRLGLFVLKGGGPALSLTDKDGRTRMLLDVDEDGKPLLAFLDKNKQLRVELGLLGDDSPTLRLNDKHGNNRATLGYAELETTRTGTVTKQSESSFVLFDKNSNVIWKAP